MTAHGFSGQGTALVGVLDAFWDEKGYITSGEFREFCDSTVTLARIPRFVFTNAENLTAEIEVSHFGSLPIENASVTWEIRNENGDKVFLMGTGRVEKGIDVIQHLTPVFWNTSWFRMRPPHTTGILIKNDHPVFSDFPTDFYSDLHYWEIISSQQCMTLENFPQDFRPLIQPIDTWFLNRRLAILFEAKVSNGKIMICSIDLQNDLNKRPVARQLLYSLISYMNSGLFNPQEAINPVIIKELFR